MTGKRKPVRMVLGMVLVALWALGAIPQPAGDLEEAMRAVVRVRATVPPEAITARTLSALKPMPLGESSRVEEGDRLHVGGFGSEAQPVRLISRGQFVGYWEYLLDDALYAAPAYAEFGGAALISEGTLIGVGSILTTLAVPEVGRRVVVTVLTAGGGRLSRPSCGPERSSWRSRGSRWPGSPSSTGAFGQQGRRG